MTVLGVALSVGCAVTAIGALSTLRGECCPSCDAIGTFALVQVEPDNCPGGNPVSTRFRRCAVCGCIVVDHGSSSSRPKWTPLAGLAHFAR